MIDNYFIFAESLGACSVQLSLLLVFLWQHWDQIKVLAVQFGVGVKHADKMAMARVRSGASKRQRLLTNPMMNPLMAMGMNPGMHPMFGTMLNPAMAAMTQPFDLDESDSENAIVPTHTASASAGASPVVPDARPASGGDVPMANPAAAGNTVDVRSGICSCSQCFARSGSAPCCSLWSSGTWGSEDQSLNLYNSSPPEGLIEIWIDSWYTKDCK